MSLAAVRWMTKQTVGDDKAKSALFWLAWHMNEETGLCCPSISTLKREMEVGSENTVRSAIARLKALGLIESRFEYTEGGAIKRTTYRINMECAAIDVGATVDGASTVEGDSIVEPPAMAGTYVPQPLRDGASTVEGVSLNGCTQTKKEKEIKEKTNLAPARTPAPTPTPAHACESRIPVAPIVIEVKAWRVARALAAARDPGIDAITQGKGTASIGYLRQLLGSQDGFKRLQPYLVKHQIRI